MLIQTVFL